MSANGAPRQDLMIGSTDLVSLAALIRDVDRFNPDLFTDDDERTVLLDLADALDLGRCSVRNDGSGIGGALVHFVETNE